MDQPRIVKNNVANRLAANATGLRFATSDEMHLFKSTFVPDQNSILADFLANEVNFTGYAFFLMNTPWIWGLDQAGNAYLNSNQIATFTQTGVIAVDNVGGWWIEDGAHGILRLADVFVNPVAMDKTGNSILIKAFDTLTDVSGGDVELIFGQ